MKWHLVYFVQGFIHSLWWLQSPEIITCNSVLVPLAHAINSMLVLAPMIILLQARPFICKQNKCIQFRQHHILMNITIITKKRKYLIIQLACASSSNWSSMYSSRGCGCNNGIDVLITATPNRAEEVSRGKIKAQDDAKQRRGPRPQRSDGRSRFPRQGSLPGRPRQDPCRGS